MNLVKSDKCLACDENQIENLPHLLLTCVFFAKIRDEYLPKLTLLNPNFSKLVNNESQLIISILNQLYFQKIQDCTVTSHSTSQDLTGMISSENEKSSMKLKSDSTINM